MKILTLGDSWTYGTESSDPSTMSWPAQLATKYQVNVTNLGFGGSSNQRATRIGIEELSRNQSYDWVILGLSPASRTEILKIGKWHQIWPTKSHHGSELDRIYTEFWHPWNDLQITLLLVIQFMSFVNLLGLKLLITGLSLHPSQYQVQMKWIQNYADDYDFNRLGMPLHELNIGVKDLDRKLRSLRAMHHIIIKHQPEYFYDVPEEYMKSTVVKSRYGSDLWAKGGHPNDAGYEVLADYFAKKINLI